MSSTGPGSLLVFLAFLMLSMLLVGTYFVAYLGLVQAGREVQKAGEAASEQAIVYLFQHPTNISMVDGRPVMKGETRIVIQRRIKGHILRQDPGDIPWWIRCR
jgi:hypothetical protein